MKTSQLSTNKLPYNRTRLLLIFLGAFIFQAIFWKEKMALNLSIYTVFIVLSLFIIYKEKTNTKNIWAIIAACVITLAAVIIQNTLLSKLAFIVALLLLMVLVTNTYKSIHYAMASVGARALQAVPQTVIDTVAFLSPNKNPKKKRKNYRMLLLPLLLCLVFTCIYLLASDVLADIASNVFAQLGDWITKFFGHIDANRILFFLLAVVITGFFLIKHNSSKIELQELTETDLLARNKANPTRKKISYWSQFVEFVTGKAPTAIMALKSEYKAGVVSLVLLNILLAVLNTTDIIFVWFSRTYKPGFEWAGYVHYGANILIFSIFLATLVLLFFFRGNINFLKKNAFIRVLSSVWIFQNLILAISVCIRNYYYIQHMGLAYKRIGLLVFLLMVVVGLITVYIKINKLKTVYYLLRINGWVAFAILVIASTIDWDLAIAKYNLSHKDSIQSDISFLLTLSDNTLPILDQHRDFIIRLKPSSQRVFNTGNLEWRKQQFLKEHMTYTWLSWNYSDSQTLAYLKNSQ